MNKLSATQSRCSVELRGRSSWRLRYRVAGERLTITVPSEAWARTAAPLIDRALDIDDRVDPWSFVKEMVPKYLSAEPDIERPKATPDLKRHVTLAEFFEIWLPTKRPPLCRVSTYQDYERRIGRCVVPLLGKIQLSKLTTEDLVRCRAYLLAKGLQGKPISKATVKAIMVSSLQRMLRDARSQGYMKTDLYDSDLWREWPKTANPVDDGPQADPFEVPEKHRILDFFRKKYLGGPLSGFVTYITLLFETGMRPSEAAGLQWQDAVLDGDEPHVRIRRSFNRGAYAPPKTGRSRREVHLPPSVVSLLKRLMPINVEPTTAICLNRYGNPIEPRTFWKVWVSSLRVLGIRPRGTYTMKDSYVTIARAAGVSWSTLERSVGVSEAVLTKHYSGVVKGSLPQEFARIQRFEAEQLGTPQLGTRKGGCK